MSFPKRVPILMGHSRSIPPCCLASRRPRIVAAAPVRGSAMATVCAILGLALTPAAARSGELEAAYVVLGGEGAIARAILSGATQCPAITIDNATAAMHLRASPQVGGRFPVMVCDALLPPGTASAAIEGRPLPVSKPSLSAIAVLGDTGCRLKTYRQAARKNDYDQPDAG